MKRRNLTTSTAAAVFALFIAVQCGAESPDDVLAENSLVRLTRADYDAALQRIPYELREDFATSAHRLTLFLNNILLRKTLAVQAHLNGVPPDPEVLREMPQEMEAALAAAQVRTIEERAAKEFDARRDSYIVAARETYRVTKERYKKPEELKISAILISTDKRGNEAALALAQATRSKLMAGFDFAALARQVSEDKDSAAQGGALPWGTEEQMNPTLARTAAALPRAGEISEPVLIGTSYVIVRLDDRHPAGYTPFEEVQDSLLASMREDYIRNQRETALDSVRNDPKLKVNHEALDALIVHVDPERMKPASTPQSGTVSPN